MNTNTKTQTIESLDYSYLLTRKLLSDALTTKQLNKIKGILVNLHRALKSRLEEDSFEEGIMTTLEVEREFNRINSDYRRAMEGLRTALKSRV
jgi:hypothetical protein